MTTTQPQDMTPQQIDTELARIWTEQESRRRSITQMTRTMLTPGRLPHRLAQDSELLERYQAELKALTAEAAPYEAEYRRRPRLRYFLVTNQNGHVHRGMDCTTCYATTEYNWIVDLADCDEAAMIAEFGEKACTVCFPDAPANPAFHAPGRRDAEALAARAAEKAAKQAEKDSKAITAPGGHPLRVGGDLIRTKVAAQRALSQAVQDYGWYGPTHPHEFAHRARQLSEALTAAGIDPQPIITRAQAKVRKEGGEHTLVLA